MPRSSRVAYRQSPSSAARQFPRSGRSNNPDLGSLHEARNPSFLHGILLCSIEGSGNRTSPEGLTGNNLPLPPKKRSVDVNPATCEPRWISCPATHGLSTLPFHHVCALFPAFRLLPVLHHVCTWHVGLAPGLGLVLLLGTTRDLASRSKVFFPCPACFVPIDGPMPPDTHTESSSTTHPSSISSSDQGLATVHRASVPSPFLPSLHTTLPTLDDGQEQKKKVYNLIEPRCLLHKIVVSHPHPSAQSSPFFTIHSFLPEVSSCPQPSELISFPSSLASG